MSTISVTSTVNVNSASSDTYLVEGGGTLVVSGAGASVTGATVFAGGVLSLLTSAAVTSVTVSGGDLAINGNANAANTTLVNGGVLELESAKANISASLTFGAGANALILDKILTSGNVSKATISGFAAGDLVELGGTFTSDTLAYATSGSVTSVTFAASGAGNTQTFVFSGALTNQFDVLATTIDAAGVPTSGVELLFGQNVTVSAGATLFAYAGGTASATTVNSGGALNLSGAATDTTLVSGGTLDLATAGATLSGGLTFSGGHNTLLVAAVATLGAGDQAVISGFATGDQIDLTAIAASGATLGFSTSGGNEIVTVSNGGVSEAFVFSGATLYTSNTLSLTSDSNGDADLQLVSGGSVTSVTTPTASGAYDIGSSQTVLVLAGGFVSATKVENGGQLTLSGGEDLGAIVSAGGSLTVSTGSAAEDQIFGSALVLAGGYVAGEIVSGGGALTLSGSGFATVVRSSGAETVVSGGQATSDMIFGSLTVTSATVSDATVETGGSATLGAGASDTGLTVFTGATLTVSAGAGSATLANDQIYGQVLTVSGDVATYTDETVYAGGVLNLFNSNNAEGTTVSSGGTLVLSGHETATDTILTSGGVLELLSPKATLTGGLTFSGGGNELELTAASSAPATTSGVTTTYGPVSVISGFSTTDDIELTSAFALYDSLTLALTTSGGETVAAVMSGAAAIETFTFSGTALSTQLALVSDGAGGSLLEILPTFVTTTVSTFTGSGVYAIGATDTLLVVDGGTVIAPVIERGGFLTLDGGHDNGALVQAGAVETVSAGTANGDQIFGSAFVGSGMVLNETIGSGGVLTLNGGANLVSALLDGGATLDVSDAGASLNGTLSFANGHNTLIVPADATADSTTISGYAGNDRIEISGMSATGASLSFGTLPGNAESVTVSNGAQSQTFIFSDGSLYNAGTMSLAPDGADNVDLVLDSTPVLNFTTLDDLTTNQSTYAINGTVDVAADPYAIGSTVSVYENGAVVGTALVQSDGFWQSDVALQNADGANTLSATDVDLAGNSGSTASSLSLTANVHAAAFTAGNLVISISGDGDGSGVYGDNQAGPAVLEQVTTSGQIVSQLVLPQTASGDNLAFSSEFGSSSEGAIQLSADGHSLTIAGYGINAATFNAGGVAVYGDDALAQSVSVPGGPYTAVARVVADIGADGAVNTSTALYDVYNTNNPRSVATVDGTQFFLSGQGDKNADGNLDQGVFTATLGASTATALNTVSDTRDIEIYDDNVYVSVDSKSASGLSGSGIYLVGSVPALESATGEVTPTILPGMTGATTLTAATQNGVNDADVGQTVYLSPENFFFANADTLYVADGGAPKLGGLGDGGLQKWVFDGSQWNLEYTLSQGLNLIANTAGASSTGDTGLIGLTGEVVGGTVHLYATTEPLNDLGTTSLVAIDDQLSATTGAGESFTTLLTASAGENIRGISFAPTGYVPTISNALGSVTTFVGSPAAPFAGVSVGDGNANAQDTVTINISGAGGALADGAGFDNLVTVQAGVTYTLTGAALALSQELDALVFTPTTQALSQSATSLNFSDLSSADATPTATYTTTVTDNGAGVPVTVAQYVANLSALDMAGGIVIADSWLNILAALDSLSADSMVVSIRSTDVIFPPLTIDAEQAQNGARALGLITASSPYSLTVEDSAANIANLLKETPAQLQSLAAASVTLLQTTDTGVTLTVAQALALEGAGVGLQTPVSATDILSDTAAQLETLTPTEIAGLSALGVTRLVATDAAVVFSLDQASALATIGAAVYAPAAGGAQAEIFYNSDGSINQINYTGVTGAPYTSYDAVYGANGRPATITYSNGLLATWNYSGDGTLLHDIKYTGVTGAAYTFYDVVYGTNGKPSSTSYSNGLTKTFSYNLDGTLHDTDYTGITGTNYSAEDVTLNANGTTHDIDYSGITGANYTGKDVTFNANGTTHDIAYAGFTGTNYSGKDVTYNADGTLHDVDLTGVTGTNYTGRDATYNSDGTLHDLSYTGVTGSVYSSYDVVYGDNGEPASATFSNGVSRAWTYQPDGAFEITTTEPAGLSILFFADIYTASDLHQAQARDLNNSSASGALQLMTDGATVSKSTDGFSIAFGDDSYSLHAHASESVNATNTQSDTFALGSGFGQMSIAGFGSGDTLDFQLSMFDPSYFTSATTPDQEALALLNHATGTTDTTITDTAKDSLTLVGVSVATLKNDLGAIHFS